MHEVKTRDEEELNGLGLTLKQIINENLQDPRKYKGIEQLIANVVVKETGSNAAVTLYFENGNIEIVNEAIDKPTASMEAGFENLADISTGQISPTMAMLTGKLKARGNLLTLLKISKIIILKKQ